ncbi:FadR/GntR family transcriptional regulator [Leucobacter sp. M11]|uniref:FadR/GntR family transcriptional regulator n=1 Tax=Leucobacter sp. M11 TaxID=2993565 RepID=UPI002D80F7BA|nr:FCD domain-containing protein [Leucobacter sp. M11]MEB4615104.1 GntR family transcriptional regulator [Leucobacter sp. M11]
MTSLTEQLRQLIRDRDYRIGERLPSERELAERFDASRPSVRRAIATLVEHGVLESRDRSGVYFRGTDPQDLLAVRLVLEPWAAAEAAARASRAEAAALRGLVAQAEAALDSAAEFARIDSAVHAAVVAAANNAVLSDLYLSLRQRIMATRAQTSALRSTRETALADLGALIAAIDAGDAPAARERMTEHLSALAPSLPGAPSAPTP